MFRQAKDIYSWFTFRLTFEETTALLEFQRDLSEKASALEADIEDSFFDRIISTTGSHRNCHPKVIKINKAKVGIIAKRNRLCFVPIRTISKQIQKIFNVYRLLSHGIEKKRHQLSP